MSAPPKSESLPEPPLIISSPALPSNVLSTLSSVSPVIWSAYCEPMILSIPYKILCVWVWKIIEIRLLDASVDSIAHFINKMGVKARPIQSGNLSSSLRLMAVGLILGLVFALILSVL